MTALTLDEKDKAKLKALDKHRRFINGKFWVVKTWRILHIGEYLGRWNNGR
jgi:hypothetical protein